MKTILSSLKVKKNENLWLQSNTGGAQFSFSLFFLERSEEKAQELHFIAFAFSFFFLGEVEKNNNSVQPFPRLMVMAACLKSGNGSAVQGGAINDS